MTQPGPIEPPLPPRVGGGAFEVDISQAPRAIRELEQAREELESIKQDAVYLGQVNPPARDQVSVDAAVALGRTAATGPDSFLAALTQGIAEIQRMVDALRSGLEAYGQTDERGGTQYSQSL